MNDEEEIKNGGEINPDALEAVFAEEILIEEGEEEDEVIFSKKEDDEDIDEIDIAFLANDEGYW